MRMKFSIAVVLTLVIAAASCTAQNATTPTSIYAAGASFSAGASPAVSGTGLYAHQVNDSGTYAFTVVDAVPSTLKPFTVTTNFSAGVARKLVTIGNIPIFIPTSAGVSWNGSNTGWAWTTGALASIQYKQTHFRIMPNLRIVKSSVSGGAGYQPVIGILFGWSQ